MFSGIVTIAGFLFDIKRIGFSNTGYWLVLSVEGLNTAVEKWLILYIPIFTKELAL
jgi:diacylglycerol kinase